mmetsp:Transcript_37911/g.120827  ORF Transcript_37911/g.120827 Transcript_37911/m.120827 type:complete len:318 (-) Transcript_37911:71-1024(-)
MLEDLPRKAVLGVDQRRRLVFLPIRAQPNEDAPQHVAGRSPRRNSVKSLPRAAAVTPVGSATEHDSSSASSASLDSVAPTFVVAPSGMSSFVQLGVHSVKSTKTVVESEVVERLKQSLAVEKAVTSKLRHELSQASLTSMRLCQHSLSKESLLSALSFRERQMVKLAQDVAHLRAAQGHYTNWEPGFPIRWAPTAPRGPALLTERCYRRREVAEALRAQETADAEAPAPKSARAGRSRLNVVSEPEGLNWFGAAGVGSPQKVSNMGGLRRERRMLNKRELHVWDWELRDLQGSTTELVVPDFPEEYNDVPAVPARFL